MQRRNSPEAGFTLLELTVALGLAGGLAAIALPSFASSTNKSKMSSEVHAFMAELRLRQEAYIGEKGAYLSTGVNELDTFPSTPSHSPQTIADMPHTWNALQVRGPAEASCAYVVIAGGPNDSVGSIASESFGYQRPVTRSWYYVLARCYDGEKDTYFFSTDDDGTVSQLGETRDISHEGEQVAAVPVPTPAPTAPTAPTPTAPTATAPPADTGSTDSTDTGSTGTGTTDTGSTDTTVAVVTDDGKKPKHANSGGGNGTECVDGVEVNPGNSGGHNNSDEGSCPAPTTETTNTNTTTNTTTTDTTDKGKGKGKD